jgi:pyrroloquinoline quinone (PQQ) biosynthesis protein C
MTERSGRALWEACCMRQAASRRERIADAIRYCREPAHLRRTLRIALVVGLLLTAINQLDVLTSGHATLGTYVKCAANFVVPFVVSNLGLLSGRANDPNA